MSFFESLLSFLFLPITSRNCIKTLFCVSLYICTEHCFLFLCISAQSVPENYFFVFITVKSVLIALFSQSSQLSFPPCGRLPAGVRKRSAHWRQFPRGSSARNCLGPEVLHRCHQDRRTVRCRCLQRKAVKVEK